MLLAADLASEDLRSGSILRRETVTLPESTPEPVLIRAEGIVLERLIYSSDGLEVEAFLVRPERESKEPIPCIIANRGGNRDFGALNPIRAAFQFGRLAQRGYVVVASNFRGNGDFGGAKYPGQRLCEDCEQRIGGHGREEFGGAEVADVTNLIPLLQQLPEADASRMGIFGWSRGGMMTHLVLKATAEQGPFKAAVIGAGIADLEASLQQRPEMEAHVYSELIPGWEDPNIRQGAIRHRSPVQWADQLPEKTPMLLLHGSADWRVEPTHALDMARALLEAKRPFRLLMLEGGDHGLTEYRDEVDRLVGEWFDHYVRDGQSWPSLEPHGR